MIIRWWMFCDAKSEKNARVLLSRFINQIGHETQNSKVNPHHRGGHILAFDTELSSAEWSEAVVDTLELAQRVGRRWTVSGSILNEFSGESSEGLPPGVTLASFDLSRPAMGA